MCTNLNNKDVNFQVKILCYVTSLHADTNMETGRNPQPLYNKISTCAILPRDRM